MWPNLKDRLLIQQLEVNLLANIGRYEHPDEPDLNPKPSGSQANLLTTKLLTCNDQSYKRVVLKANG